MSGKIAILSLSRRDTFNHFYSAYVKNMEYILSEDISCPYKGQGYSLMFNIYHSQFSICEASDPTVEYHRPFVYCANNSIMFVDPDGCETPTTNEDNIATNMVVNDHNGKNSFVYLNGKKAGDESLLLSYIYKREKNNIDLTIVKEKYKYYVIEMLNFLLKFKYDFKSDHSKQRGIAFNTVISPQDAGNSNWGAYYKDRCGLNKKGETPVSLSMQHWDVKKAPNHLGN